MGCATLMSVSNDNDFLGELIGGVLQDITPEEGLAVRSIITTAAEGDADASSWLRSYLQDEAACNRLIDGARSLAETGRLPRAERGRYSLSLVAALETSIRNALLDAGGHEAFPMRRWYQLVAALDSIGDTVLALESYLFDEKPSTHGGRYLRLFGMLACVATQQDSVRLLEEDLLGTKTRWEGGADTLRTLRNNVAIHPAKNGGAVARLWIAKDTIPFLMWEHGEPKHEDIDVAALLLDHLGSVAAILSRIEPAAQNLGDRET